MSGSKRTLSSSSRNLLNEPEKKRSRPTSEDNTPKLKALSDRHEIKKINKRSSKSLISNNYGSSTSSSDIDSDSLRNIKTNKYSRSTSKKHADDPSLEWKKVEYKSFNLYIS